MKTGSQQRAQVSKDANHGTSDPHVDPLLHTTGCPSSTPPLSLRLHPHPLVVPRC